ncbi:hypothetical protein [Mycoplasmopsis columbinasalis]|uniref:Uncharacterized protein n=1 Tax=Mycoplasmopsis columbinasalis TaxID=114880 RepID=A0A449B9X6_9BACT|nr:hypothetical protein [Mycoplasmopsis columbinasalis]VEU77999.1 Uncharacterised protein [Mycoplasmopsis columbinasalis]
MSKHKKNFDYLINEQKPYSTKSLLYNLLKEDDKLKKDFELFNHIVPNNNFIDDINIDFAQDINQTVYVSDWKPLETQPLDNLIIELEMLQKQPEPENSYVNLSYGSKYFDNLIAKIEKEEELNKQNLKTLREESKIPTPEVKIHRKVKI